MTEKSVFINEHASKRWDFAPDDFIFILFFENNPKSLRSVISHLRHVAGLSAAN